VVAEHRDTGWEVTCGPGAICGRALKDTVPVRAELPGDVTVALKLCEVPKSTGPDPPVPLGEITVVVVASTTVAVTVLGLDEVL
jgi:hypothetical protein